MHRASCENLAVPPERTNMKLSDLKIGTRLHIGFGPVSAIQPSLALRSAVRQCREDMSKLVTF